MESFSINNISTTKGTLRFTNLSELKGESIAVYGTGLRARQIWDFQKTNNNFNIKFFIDTHYGGEFLGKKVIKHSPGKKYNTDLVVIASEFWCQILGGFESLHKIAVYEFPLTKLKHIFVDEKLKLIYVCNFKCGSSTVRHIMGVDNIKDEQIFTVQELHEHEFKKFTIVRDPIQRLVSGFNMFFTPRGIHLLSKAKKDHWSHIENYQSIFIKPLVKLIDDSGKKIDINTFIKFYLLIPDSLMDPHFMPQCHLAKVCDQVGALDDLIPFLASLGFNEINHMSERKLNEGTKQKHFLDANSLSLIEEKYSNDIQLYNSLPTVVSRYL